ncbi:MAG TPA: ABC transporter permease [Capillimicrobium sp.]|nr:ABC transporter permease [Capillimicrobium sp.]
MDWAELSFWTLVLGGAVRLATPVVLAALGEALVERSGMINLGIEGMMLAGALAGAWGAATAGWGAGVLLALAVGAALGLTMALLVLWGGANQLVVGLAVTLLAGGLSTYLFQLWQPSGRTAARVPLAPVVDVPGLSSIPLVGEALFEQSVFTYLAVALVVLAAWSLRRTGVGLAVRATGDDPARAALRGVAPRRVRAATLAVGGALAGLGGCVLTVGYLGSFTDNVTGGRGYVALAAVIIGRWSPLGALAGAAVFAVFDALALQAQGQGSGIPIELFTALPYVVTLLVLIAVARGSAAPRALGRPLDAAGG